MDHARHRGPAQTRIAGTCCGLTPCHPRQLTARCSRGLDATIRCLLRLTQRSSQQRVAGSTRAVRSGTGSTEPCSGCWLPVGRRRWRDVAGSRCVTAGSRRAALPAPGDPRRFSRPSTCPDSEQSVAQEIPVGQQQVLRCELAQQRAGHRLLTGRQRRGHQGFADPSICCCPLRSDGWSRMRLEARPPSSRRSARACMCRCHWDSRAGSADRRSAVCPWPSLLKLS